MAQHMQIGTRMTLTDIKAAVEAGKTVHWSTPAYRVIKGAAGRWLIACTISGGCIGLTWADGVTLNGRPDDFYIAGPQPA